MTDKFWESWLRMDAEDMILSIRSVSHGQWGFPRPGPSIQWFCLWMSQEAKPSNFDDGSKEPLTAQKQWKRQRSGKFCAWSDTDDYCLISHLWWRHGGKKNAPEHPRWQSNGIKPSNIQTSQRQLQSGQQNNVKRWVPQPVRNTWQANRNRNRPGKVALTNIWRCYSVHSKSRHFCRAWGVAEYFG